MAHLDTESRSSAIERRSLQDIVTDRIRDMILQRQLVPGARLRQDELAGQLNVSTMPVREALRRLQAEGLVTFQPNRGASVVEVSAADFEEVNRIREELTVLACRWLAQDYSRAPISDLREILAELEKVEPELDVPRREQLAREFWFAIFKATGKEQQIRIQASGGLSFPVVRSSSMHKHRSRGFVYGIQDPILVREPDGVEAVKISHKLLPGERVHRDP